MPDSNQIRGLYSRRARRYDLSANLYYLAGFREQAYRKAAVAALDLKHGATIVEIGCGTGLNFGLLQQSIGPQGRIIGVDLTPAMLDVARQRCQRHGWKNVELIEHDAGTYEFPTAIDGVISTFALTLVPEYERVIEHTHRALGIGGKMVVADLRIPDWPRSLVRLGVWLTSPFGVNLEIAERHPWEGMRAVFGNLTMIAYYFGAVYITHSHK